MHRRCRRHSFIQLRQSLWSGLAGDDSGNTYCVCGRTNFKESLAKWISLVSLMWRFIVCRRNTFFYRETAAQRLYWIMGWMLNYVAEDWMGEHFHHNSKHDHTFVTGQEQWTLCSKVYPRLLWTPGDIRTSTCVLLPVLKVKQQSLITTTHQPRFGLLEPQDNALAFSRSLCMSVVLNSLSFGKQNFNCGASSITTDKT